RRATIGASKFSRGVTRIYAVRRAIEPPAKSAETPTIPRLRPRRYAAPARPVNASGEGCEALDDRGMQGAVRSDEPAIIDEPGGAVGERDSRGIGQTTARGGHERIDRAGVPSAAGLAGADVSVCRPLRHLSPLQAGATHDGHFPRPDSRQGFLESGGPMRAR